MNQETLKENQVTTISLDEFKRIIPDYDAWTFAAEASVLERVNLHIGQVKNISSIEEYLALKDSPIPSDVKPVQVMHYRFTKSMQHRSGLVMTHQCEALLNENDMEDYKGFIAEYPDHCVFSELNLKGVIIVDEDGKDITNTLEVNNDEWDDLAPHLENNYVISELDMDNYADDYFHKCSECGDVFQYEEEYTLEDICYRCCKESACY